ncbi:MAG: hypothetical protein HY906_11460 [Deltaproteobacteria bacterium]|nr:hypothetical protein [Deltaproteobacteria bacterium]
MSSGWLTWRRWAIPAVLVSGVTMTVVVSRHQGRAFVSYADAEVAAVKNVHAYKGKPVCQACHLRRDRRLRGDPIQLCQRCHSFEHRNHPVNVVMKPERRPADLPLADGGRVACHSCHDPHVLTAFKHGLRMELTPMCQRCHKGH